MTDRFVARCEGTGKPLAIFIAIAVPLLRGLCVCGLLASALQAQAQESRVPSLQQLAPGVYAAIAQHNEPQAQNRGVVGNQGVIIGTDGVILINTGTSARHVADLLVAIGGLTDKPIVLAINTHQNPAFVFGNGTLALQGVPILAHHDVAALIAQRCHTCLKKLIGILGVDEMEGTEVAVPTQTLDGAMTIDIAGRTLDILYYGTSSSPGSIGVVDRKSSVLFAGGLVSIGRIPDAKDANIAAWLTALEDIRARSPTKIVPGEGPVSSVSELADLSGYLIALESMVKNTFEGGISLGKAAEASHLPQFQQWPMYENAHKKNVENEYLRLERRALNE